MYKRGLIHLRKSRADIEAEARGEGETLARHEKVLLKLASDLKINVINRRKELESGESLLHRPEMLLTLKEVEQGLYDCVICMDVDRLGRGDMQDQGLILNTFKKANTHIVTPRKTYNLNDEWDEEYTEFEAFMARKELKIINRRLQSGRIRSIDEGNYIGTRPPFGYLVKTEGKHNRYLIPHPEQTDIIKMIFEWYTTANMGTGKIANELNRLGYKSYTDKPWRAHMVLNIIKNKVYAGFIQWKKKEYKKSTTPGKKRDSKTRPKTEWIEVKGKHESLISLETFEKTQKILEGNSHVPYKTTITNPLAGLIRCSKCGTSMAYRPYGNRKPHIVCYICDNKSSRFDIIEARLLDGLRLILQAYKDEWSRKQHIENHPNHKLEFLEKSIKNLENEIKDLDLQKNNLHDLLERGVYDIETFLKRSEAIGQRIESTKLNLSTLTETLTKERNFEINKISKIPKFEHVLDTYPKESDPGIKNRLLKTIIKHATYNKEKHQKNDEFTLDIQPLY